MKSIEEYYAQKIYEDNLSISFNPKEYTINGSTIKATADKLYDNIFDGIKNNPSLYSYITQNGTGTNTGWDKRFIDKQLTNYTSKIEFVRTYIGLFNQCVFYDKKGDMVNLDKTLNSLKYFIQTLKDVKLWK